MTVEELEIIVTARVEGTIKEFKKIVPTTKKIVQQIQESFGKIDTKVMTNKIKQAVQFIKNKIEDIKKSNKNNSIEITVNNKDAQKQISEVQKQIDSLEKKINSRQIKLNITNNTLDKMKADTNQQVIKDMPNAGNKMINKETYKRLENDSSYTSLIQESDKLNSEIIKYNLLLGTAKGNMTQLEQETSKNAISQNKSTVFFSSFKGKIEEAKTKAGGLQNIFGDIPKITKNITNNIKGIGSGLKNGLGNITKYVSSLFSLKDIYGILSNSAQSWLSSQNAEAQQFSANIEYMKYAMGSVFAPIIQTVINLVYQLMKAIQSVVYAFSGVNIFAKATATSMESTASGANKSSKSLSSIHSEISNASGNSSNESSLATPSIDLSSLDTQTSNWIYNIRSKLYTLFNPIQNAWDNYGETMIASVKNALNSVWGLIKAIGESFEEVWLNGTGKTTISLILQILTNICNIISAISIAWTGAWKNNGNGTATIQNLWNILNNILGTINDVVISIKEWWQSDSGQAWANSVISIFNTISGWIDTLTANIKKIWDEGGSHFFTALSNLGSNMVVVFNKITQAIGPLIQGIINLSGSALAKLLDIIGTVIDKFNNFIDFFVGENTEKLDVWSIIIGSLATAIGLVVGALTLWNMVQGAWNVIVGIGSTIGTIFAGVMAILTSPITLVILAIAALIAIIVSIIVYWDEISAALSAGWEWIKQKAEEIFNAIADFFKNLWQGICDAAVDIWNRIKDLFVSVWTVISTFFSDIWNGIKNIAIVVWDSIITTISNIINNIKNTISNVLNAISTVWNNIWNGIKTVVTNVWNGIWNTIRNVINSILGGIEGFVNGIIRGINVLLKGISSVANAVGSLIGLKPINLQLSTISLPRLAKGGVLYNETMFIGGEYSGASTNPEIVTPQNIMEETFDRVMSRYQSNNASNSGDMKQLVIQFGSQRVALEMESLIKQAHRRNGTAYATI